jgi:protein transport protein SEC31
VKTGEGSLTTFFFFPAIQTHDYPGALHLQVGLVTTKYGECGAWLVGVKRLIDHAQQTM